MFNNLTIKFILLFAALFFYTLNCFVPFNGEIVYTIDFILILLIVFYLITGSKKFESSYSFLASSWGSYTLTRKLFIDSSLTTKKSITGVFGLFTVRYLVCLETSVVGTKVLDTSVKTNLIGTLF